PRVPFSPPQERSMRRLVLTALTIGAMVGLLAAARQTGIVSGTKSLETTWIGCVQPRISPDGSTIAVSYQGAIWTVPRSGGVMKRLTRGTGFDIEPVWSPDGLRIAYVNSSRFGPGELRITTLDGKDVPLSKRVEVPGTILYQKLEWLPN